MSAAIWLNADSKVLADPILQGTETQGNKFKPREVEKCSLYYEVEVVQPFETGGSWEDQHQQALIICNFTACKVVYVGVLLGCLDFHGNLKERFAEPELEFWVSSKYKIVSQHPCQPIYFLPKLNKVFPRKRYTNMLIENAGLKNKKDMHSSSEASAMKSGCHLYL